MYSTLLFFFFNDTATTEIYTLSLHDALPISRSLGVDVDSVCGGRALCGRCQVLGMEGRSEEHTSELQSPCNLVCRLLLEKKKATSRGNLVYVCFACSARAGAASTQMLRARTR